MPNSICKRCEVRLNSLATYKNQRKCYVIKSGLLITLIVCIHLLKGCFIVCCFRLCGCLASLSDYAVKWMFFVFNSNRNWRGFRSSGHLVPPLISKFSFIFGNCFSKKKVSQLHGQIVLPYFWSSSSTFCHPWWCDHLFRNILLYISSPSSLFQVIMPSSTYKVIVFMCVCIIVGVIVRMCNDDDDDGAIICTF